MDSGFFAGFVIGCFTVWILGDILSCIFRIFRYGSVIRSNTSSSSSILITSGVFGSSIVQQNGRVWINGVEQGTGEAVRLSCTKSLKITADGIELNQQLQPGTPIVLQVEPGVVVHELHVGDDLRVESGNIVDCANLHVGDDCEVRGNVMASAIKVGDDLTVHGDLTSHTVSAGDDIHVTGKATWESAKAGDDIIVQGEKVKKRQRRGSFI